VGAGDGSTASAVAEELADAMTSIRRSIRRNFGRAWPASLTGAQVDVLRVIRHRSGISVRGVAEELGVAPNTVSTLVSQLTEAGLVQRCADRADRRVVRLVLTRQARQHVDAWRTRRSVLLADGLAALEEDEQRRIAEVVPCLRLLAARLQAVDP
jgi:DNA-binding MarR family transcriptional regulator